MPRLSRTSPYWPVLSHPLLRRVLPGLAVSALGDGMAVVAVTWLAIQLAPPGQRGLWIAVAMAAYTLPSAVGTVAFGRMLRGRSGAQLAGWDAILRAAALAAIPIAHLVGILTVGLYAVLLAASALLHSWGSAGRFTLIAELLPQRHHLPANAVLTTISGFATIVGPPLAGILIGWAGPVWVIAADAATFAVLALTYRLALPATGTIHGYERSASRTAGFAFIRRQPALLGLLALTVAFFFLFGPVYVAMPLHITDDLHASAPLLGAYYIAFGVGGLLGGVITGHLRRWPLHATTVGIVVGFGAAMLPLGVGAPVALSLPAFALAGLIWAPYMSTSMALFQRSAPTEQLPAVLAANGAVTVLAVPLGTMFGGPLVGAIGPRPTLLICGTAILALGLVASGIMLLRSKPPRDVPSEFGPGSSVGRVTEDESIRRYGLRPSGADLPHIRRLLLAEANRAQQDQDTELMKLCCLQLFNAGQLDDVLLIWEAKESSFDAHCSIDVQLLCGAGLAATKDHLAADCSPEASAARTYLLECEAAGDFDGFSVAEQARWRADYYLT